MDILLSKGLGAQGANSCGQAQPWDLWLPRATGLAPTPTPTHQDPKSKTEKGKPDNNKDT